MTPATNGGRSHIRGVNPSWIARPPVALWRVSCETRRTVRRGVLLIAGVVAAASGCRSEARDDREPLPTIGVTRAQLDAFDALEIDTQRTWKWVQHPTLGTPEHLSAARIGAGILKPGDDIRLRTIDVLRTNRALFKMRDPGLELLATRAERDTYGMQHVRFQQVSHGVPVAGAEVSAHYDEEGRLASIDASYVPELDSVDVNPRLAAADALAMVKADVLSHTPIAESALVADAGKLVIYERKLAWEYRVRALESKAPAIWVVTVDARSGDILHRYDDLETVAASGVGVLGDTKKFEVSSGDGGGFVMSDASSGIQIVTYSASQLESAPGTLVASNTATSWDSSGTGRGAAVDAHFNAGVVAKYYKNVHGRNAIDGAGGPMLSTVHYGAQYENAAWIQTGMIYGDGGKIFKALSVAVDVVGHEMTHGVTEKTSHLTYENQSGALNEAVSDIFGAFIEHSVAPDARKNWIIGELCTLDGSSLRDMMQPHNVTIQPQPAHMNEYLVTAQDGGGVHINSGIINNAAWLMTVGGTNPVSGVQVKYGIGWEKSEKLWYQANTNYFQASTSFAQAANALQQAGKDIHLTDNELAIVDCAFKATGVSEGECDSITKPAGATAEGASSSSSGSTTKKKSTKKTTVTTEEPGCNASESRDLGSLWPIFAVLTAIAARRRRAR